MTARIPDAEVHAAEVSRQEKLERIVALQNEVIAGLQADVVKLERTSEELTAIVRALGVQVRGAS